MYIFEYELLHPTCPAARTQCRRPGSGASGPPQRSAVCSRPGHGTCFISNHQFLQGATLVAAFPFSLEDTSRNI